MQAGGNRFGKWAQSLRALVLLFCALCAMNAYSASKTILVLGDSLSAGYGLQNGAGWVSLLEKRLQENRIDAGVVNASISGDTTSGGRSRLPALLKKYQPDLMILELGANDGLRGLSLQSTEDNLRSMIDSAQKAGARVLLLGMQIPPNYGPDYTRRFAQLYPKLAAERKTALVPFFLDGVAERADLFQSDRLHPTAAAQAMLLDTVWPRLYPLLSK
jgi:acyl-CoA thioesterase-1